MQRLQASQVFRACSRLKHTNPEAMPDKTNASTPTTNPLAHRSATTSRLVDEFIRVDHAGELGADQIYAGQMAVLGNLGLTISQQFIIYINSHVYLQAKPRSDQQSSTCGNKRRSIDWSLRN